MQGFKEISTQLLIQQVLVPIFRLMGLLTIVFIIGVVSEENIALIIIIAGALGAFALSLAVYHRYPIRNRTDIRPIVPLNDLMTYALQALLMSVVAEIGNGSQTFLLGLFASSSEIGIFAVAAKAAMILGLFLTSLNLIAAPTISSLYAKGDQKAMHTLYQVITRWAFALTLPFFLMTVVLAQEIMGIFGPEFRAGGPVLQLIALGQIVNVATGPCGWMLNMTNHQHLNVINNLMALLIAAVLSIKLIPLYGAIGAAIVMGISILFINLLRAIQVYRVLRMHPYNILFLKPIFAGLLSIIISFGLNHLASFPTDWMRFIICTSTMFLVYVAIILLLKLEQEDKLALRNVLRRESFIS
jgi:O-antigen/teichoic acid export membrane protein